MRGLIAIAFVVARAENGVIGVAGKLPWHLPADLQHFKRLTLGKPVLMGRKTYESIGRPLPRRTNIVITRDTAWRAEGVVIAHDVPTALSIAYEEAHRTGVDEVAVIGGAELYRQILPQAQVIHLTEVHRGYAGDAHFDLPLAGWRETARERHPEAGDQPAYSFVTLERA